MKSKYRKTLESLVQIVSIPAAAYCASQASLLLQHASLVLLIGPNLVDPLNLPYILAMIYSAFAGTGYLAATNREERPNYPLLAVVLASAPALALLHEPIINGVNSAKWFGNLILHVYLVISLALPLLLVCLCLLLRSPKLEAAPESSVQ